jgi:DNA-binding CsgD family transcriptional regulator
MDARSPAAAAAAEDAVGRACARATAPESLLVEVADVVRRAVPYRAAGWILTDPGTGVITAIHAEGVDADVQRRLIEQERMGGDVNSFAALATRRTPVGRLSVATRGRLHRSPRHRALYAPLGFGDELRAVFRSRNACWGQVCLTRAADGRWFSAEEERLLARVAVSLADGLRGCQPDRPAPPDAPDARADEGPGVLVVGEDGDLRSVSAAAERLLAELPGDGAPLPSAVHDVSARARALSRNGSGPPARAVVPGRSGSAVVIRGSVLTADGGARSGVAIVLEAAGSTELAPLRLAVAGVTEREREVIRLLLAGVATTEIARRLWISTHTVRGHVKSVLTKLGVRSRAELSALLGQARL